MKKNIIIIFIIIFLLVTTCYLWARYIGTKGLVVKEYKIEAPISDNFHGLKIIHFSDLYYGSTINAKQLKNIVTKINFINPDIVFFTGNLTNYNDGDSTNILTQNLKNINASIGKYAVYGNIDNNDNFKKILTDANFNILNNTYELIYKKGVDNILISGINTDNEDTIKKLATTYEYLENNKPIYKILLSHFPDVSDNVNEFDLILSGHSLNRQINIPIIKNLFKDNGSIKYYSPYYKINNTQLYISSGLGTKKNKLRLFNKPSINFYRIVNE